MIYLYPYERSSDWQEGTYRLTVKTAFSKSVNFRDEHGRRYSLLVDAEDYLPRSALIEGLPPMASGHEIGIGIIGAAVKFNPSTTTGLPDRKFRGLWLEWLSLIDNAELKCILENLEEPFKLVGLGPGLTPAGDDFLVGWITASKLAGRNSNKLSGEIEEALSRKTTWFSSEMIRDALDGKFWKRGIELARALNEGESLQVLEKAGRIINWGHSSGRAWLAGFAFGIERGSDPQLT
ncbi:MAG: DUF2877 domain-containing protein [Kosmotogaceae bacterium]|nr:DUF2877 domain-containing protein [Kosmotogaceae bacterium]